MLDRREDRCGVVLGAIDHEVATKPRGNDQCRDPGSWTPLVRNPFVVALSGGCHVVPRATEFVVGRNHEGVVLAGGSLDGLDQINEVTAALTLTGITGMLVLRSDGLDEAHGLQLAL